MIKQNFSTSSKFNNISAPTKDTHENHKSIIYLAGGCFWGVQAYINNIKGVINTYVGYANGDLNKLRVQSSSGLSEPELAQIGPTYEEVCSGTTNFTEACEVIYNPQFLTLNKLLDYFFKIIDPTSLNKQGYDKGTQYRTGIYYQAKENVTEQIITLINEYIISQQQNYIKPIVVEIDKIHNFYNAEDYHQNYLKKNPNGYCHINPALIKAAKDF
ncbi:Peptide methionine sulfoxide reductase MsrA [Candidatus Hepatincolaceae symbiont of Richtersius coronifer]